METKPLLYGLIGFFLGGLLVSVAATTFDKPEPDNSANHMSMSQMTDSLEGKTGDAFDAAFIDAMIIHHQGAIDMAKEAQQRAKHQEIKDLSTAIIVAQQREITQIQDWQRIWGYDSAGHNGH